MEAKVSKMGRPRVPDWKKKQIRMNRINKVLNEVVTEVVSDRDEAQKVVHLVVEKLKA